jgi:hypothetical protein
VEVEQTCLLIAPVGVGTRRENSCGHTFGRSPVARFETCAVSHPRACLPCHSTHAARDPANPAGLWVVHEQRIPSHCWRATHSTGVLFPIRGLWRRIDLRTASSRALIYAFAFVPNHNFPWSLLPLLSLAMSVITVIWRPVRQAIAATFSTRGCYS